MNWKKYRYIALSICMHFIHTYSAYTLSDFDFQLPDVTQSHSPEIINLATVDPDYFNIPVPDITHSNQYRFTPEEIILALQAVGAFKVLESPFYQRTNALNQRSLLDLPFTEPRPCKVERDRMFVAHIFYNHTLRSYFTGHSSDIKSYLDLKQQTLIGLIDNITTLPGFEEFFSSANFDFDLDRILNLFRNTTVNDRRAGLMLQFLGHYRNIHLRILYPFYYHERNFYLTDKEQKAIEHEFGATTKKEQKEFQERYLISDKLGFGDMRIELDFKLFKKVPSLRLGLFTTLPIAFSLKKGMMGTIFPKPSCQPFIDFSRLFDIVMVYNSSPEQQEQLEQEARCIIESFALGALDRLSANLLEPSLGNGGHFGIGAFLRTKTPLAMFLKWPWANKVSFNNRMSIEYQFSALRKRFFIKNPDLVGFRQRDFDDPDQAESNLLFLERELIDRAYPIALDTPIHKGFIFRTTSQFCWAHNNWGLIVGTDWWVQSTEHLGVPHTGPETLTRINRYKAKMPFAYQNKIMGSVVYTHYTPERDWHFSFIADKTMISAGIGKDYTLAISIETSF